MQIVQKYDYNLNSVLCYSSSFSLDIVIDIWRMHYQKYEEKLTYTSILNPTCQNFDSVTFIGFTVTYWISINAII